MHREKLFKNLCVMSLQIIIRKIPYTGQDSIHHDKK